MYHCKSRTQKGNFESEVKNIGIPRVLLLFLVFCCLSLVSPVSAEEIKSRAAVVMDARTGKVLYAKNPGLRLMPASTTKLMTALVVLERAHLDDVVTVSRNAAYAPPIKIGLKTGDKVTIETLLNAALIKSANDAAVALAEAVAGSEDGFVDLMNRKALAIGLDDTRYINSNGLPGSGQYITAYDLAEIMKNAIRYPLLREILGTRVAEVSTEGGKTMFVKNTNRLLWSDDEFMGGKTGYTRQARHCFVGAGERASETLIVALLGTPSRDLLWSETEALLAFGSKVLNNLEEPVVYITKIDYEAAKLRKASYKKKLRIKKAKKKRRN
ncbi:MAG: D-alanyl-D-alanine carboxypeptidase [Nitrospirota bacterium]|nr:D-alanyl-D-alanine carboxypeptidase [Nitrospirota bacterium]